MPTSKNSNNTSDNNSSTVRVVDANGVVSESDATTSAYSSNEQTYVSALEKSQTVTISDDSFTVPNTDPAFEGNVYHDDGTASTLRAPFSENDAGEITMNSAAVKSDINTMDSSAYKSIFHTYNIFSREEIHNRLYTDTFRYGVKNPYETLTTGREYLFFTKPDLHIFAQNDDGTCVPGNLNDDLSSYAFWQDLYDYRKDTIACLQESCHAFCGLSPSGAIDPFNHLLANQVISNLEIGELTAETVDTAVNMYGVGYSYRGSSEASDDNPTFSLEFADTKYLDTYYFFKAYEEYEVLKHHGIIAPAQYYITNKVLHDQFAIYKFIVDEDMETIIYFGKMFGVMPISLPRDVFTNPTFDTGISYTVQFKAAFYEDMKPEIISDFNRLSADVFSASKYFVKPHNAVMDRADGRTATAAYIVKDKTSPRAAASRAGYVYRLLWKGDRAY